MKAKTADISKWWYANGLWHYKPTKRAMTRVYQSREQMIAAHPEIPKNKIGLIFEADIEKPGRKAVISCAGSAVIEDDFI